MQTSKVLIYKSPTYFSIYQYTPTTHTSPSPPNRSGQSMSKKEGDISVLPIENS